MLYFGISGFREKREGLSNLNGVKIEVLTGGRGIFIFLKKYINCFSMAMMESVVVLNLCKNIINSRENRYKFIRRTYGL